MKINFLLFLLAIAIDKKEKSKNKTIAKSKVTENAHD
jgi:hypothetical protein